MTWMLVLEGVVALLLVATMIFCWRLNGRLNEMRDAKAEMAKLIAELDRATARAAKAIADLRAATDGAGAALERKVGEAHGLTDDLKLMIDAGERLADRLDGGIESARRFVPRENTIPFPDAAARSDAERDLAKMLRRVK